MVKPAKDDAGVPALACRKTDDGSAGEIWFCLFDERIERFTVQQPLACQMVGVSLLTILFFVG
ncbi:hypothetical protein [Geotalea uraniireducens]|uniref:hypothetical protein n=1 Tax=Geotalea uraniireducens TaxID=351604 RepID=UPI00059EA259|nr:hypothetical protein [Geotalea uraniireducens]